jgi:hypothetical protein
MRTAKTKAQFARIKKTISGKEKKIGINKFYEELPFNPKNGFQQALAKSEGSDQRLFKGPKWGTWVKKTFIEKEYKHQFENFAKGFLYYYEQYDGGTGEEHTVYFEWKKLKRGFNLTVFLKPWYGSWDKQDRPKNKMESPGSGGNGGSGTVPLKRDPIPGPPTAGVDPPQLPPCPPPPKN